MPFDPYYGNSSDEELLALARTAGVLPEDVGVQSHIDMEETEPQSAYDFSQPAPSYNIDMEETEPRSAYDFSQSNAQPGQPPSTSHSQSTRTSASNRGFSMGKYAEVSKTDQELNHDLSAAEAEGQAREDRMVEPLAYAQEGAVDAEKAKARAEVNAIKAKGENALVLQRIHDEFAAEEAQANALAQSQSNKAKADYLAALSEFRASRVDPSQLWQHMSGGERFGTLVTAFVHDFLGAKGINTSAMATLNKAIDRNIDAQVMGIKTKGEVAEGFKSLWYMQRNQASSDAEARTRVRGFLLEGAKQAVIANMTQYEAGMATAQGQQALAKLDEELAKNLIEIYRHADANALSLRNQALEKWKTKLNASMESWANSIAQQNADTNRYRAVKETGVKGPEPIYDPETGKARWIFHPWIQDKERVDTRTLMEDLNNITGSFDTLRSLAREMDSTNDLVARTRLADTMHQKFDALATSLGHSMAKANGERATDQDVKDFLKGMREKTFFNQAEVEKVIAFTQENLLKPAYSKVRNVARDTLPGEENLFPQAATGIPFEASRVDAHNTSEPPPPTREEKARAGALEKLSPELGGQEYKEKNSEVEKAHKKALQFDPVIFTETEQTNLDNGIVPSQFGSVTTQRPIRNFEAGLVELRRLARSGDKRAMEQIIDYAGPYLNNLPGKDDKSAFAAFILSTLED